jgi:hypothetical protein
MTAPCAAVIEKPSPRIATARAQAEENRSASDSGQAASTQNSSPPSR